jgi:Spy/CpxP family protein refolding chaperone
MISPRRLSKIIQTTLSKRVQSHLLDVYDCLTPRQKKAIREDMQKIINKQ